MKYEKLNLIMIFFHFKNRINLTVSVLTTFTFFLNSSCTQKYLQKNIKDPEIHKDKALEVVVSSNEAWQGRLIATDMDTVIFERYGIKWQGNTYSPVVLDTIMVCKNEIKEIHLITVMPHSQSFRIAFIGLFFTSSVLFLAAIAAVAAALSGLD